MDYEVRQQHIKKEKAKARLMKKTGWWFQKLAKKTCYYCSKNFPPELLTLDHVVPLSRGGFSSKGNMVPACKTCNTAKKDATASELYLGFGLP